MKLVVPEPGSADAVALWSASHTVLSSRLLYPEARAAVARATREERLHGRQTADARRLVEALWEEVDRIEVDDDLVREAGDLADAHALRAYDAVHLASILSAADAQPVLVSADRALTAAADSLGLRVAVL